MKHLHSYKILRIAATLAAFAVAIGWPGALSGQTFGGSGNKPVIGNQTTALGVTYYGNAAPNVTPSASNWRTVVRFHVDTSAQVQWAFLGSTWKAQGVIRRVTPPPATATNGSATLDYRYAQWQADGDSTRYTYDFQEGCWSPLGVYRHDTIPTNVAAGVGTGAVCYEFSPWLNTDNDSLYLYQDGTWLSVGTGSGGGSVVDNFYRDGDTLRLAAGVDTFSVSAVEPDSAVYATLTTLADSMAIVRDSIDALRADIGTGGGGSGTVTSVGLSLPSIFSVSGSPVTTSGTLTGTLATQANNSVFAGPVSGGPSTPSFRVPGATDVAAWGGVTGSGTTNYLPKFTSSTALGNSNIFDNGTAIGIGTATPLAAFDFNLASTIASGTTPAVHLRGGYTMSNTLTAFSSPVYFSITPTITSNLSTLRPIAASITPTWAGTSNARNALFLSNSGIAAQTAGINISLHVRNNTANENAIYVHQGGQSGTVGLYIDQTVTPIRVDNVVAGGTGINLNAASGSTAFRPFDVSQISASTPISARMLARHTTAGNSTVYKAFSLENASTASTGSALGAGAGVGIDFNISNPSALSRVVTIWAAAPNQSSLPNVVDLNFSTMNNSSLNNTTLTLSGQNSFVGINQTAPIYTVDITGTGLRGPVRNTASRPTGATGVIGYNSTWSGWDMHNGTAWRRFLDLPDATPTINHIPYFDGTTWATSAISSLFTDTNIGNTNLTTSGSLRTLTVATNSSLIIRGQGLNSAIRVSDGTAGEQVSLYSSNKVNVQSADTLTVLTDDGEGLVMIPNQRTLLTSDLFDQRGPFSLGKRPTASFSSSNTVIRNSADASTYLIVQSGRDSTVNGEAGIRLSPTGNWGSVLEFGSALSPDFNFYSHHKARQVARIVGNIWLLGQSTTPSDWGNGGKLVVLDTCTVGNALVFAKKLSANTVPIAMFSSSTDDRFTFNDNGVQRNHVYGSGNMEAADLTKTRSGYPAHFATDGTLIEDTSPRTEISATATRHYTLTTAATNYTIDTLSSAFLTEFTYSAGILTYTGTATRRFLLNYSLSIATDDSVLLSAGIDKNGAGPLSSTRQAASIGTNAGHAATANISGTGIVGLSTSDTLKIVIQSDGAGAPIASVRFASFTITPID